jgi:aminoglycoside phosphotransferase (APT) family kinase protein
MLSTPERVARRVRGGEHFLLKADIAAADRRLRALRSDDAPDRPPADAALARAVETVTGVAVARVCSPPVRGTFRWVSAVDLADGRRAVVRMHRLRHPALEAALAVDLHLGIRLRTRAVRAPAAIAVDTSGSLLPCTFAVFERVAGVPLASVEGNEEGVLAGLRSLGTALRDLHAVRGAGAGPLEPCAVPTAGLPRGRFRSWADYLRCRLPAHLARCVSAGVVTAGEAERIAGIFAGDDLLASAVADRLLHGDPGPANVMVGADGTVTGLVDWEDALVGDPLFELASVASFHPEVRWPSLFDGYLASPSIAPADERRFWTYLLRIALARTVMRLRFGIADLPGRAPAHGRIHRALEAFGEAQ